MRTPLQAFEYLEVDRTQIVFAPYNPRVITAESEARLRQNLVRVGLLTTLIWNKRTGHLVGGHQRLRLLDELEGSTNYRIGVAAIDVDEQAERELNVFLNNTWAQGEYDADKLLALLQQEGGAASVVDAMGFSPAEMLLEFGARDELAGVMPGASAGPVRRTAQDTLGPHVLLVFRSNADKTQFLAHLGHPDAAMRMPAEEVLDYLRPEERWRTPVDASGR